MWTGTVNLAKSETFTTECTCQMWIYELSLKLRAAVAAGAKLKALLLSFNLFYSHQSGRVRKNEKKEIPRKSRETNVPWQYAMPEALMTDEARDSPAIGLIGMQVGRRLFLSAAGSAKLQSSQSQSQSQRAVATHNRHQTQSGFVPDGRITAIAIATATATAIAR